MYMDSGKLNCTAVLEPLLPCYPCPVKEFPPNVLGRPWQKVVKKLQKQLLEKAQHIRNEEEKIKQELGLGGMNPLMNSPQKFIIMQSCSTGAPISIPVNFTAIAPLPRSTASADTVNSSLFGSCTSSVTFMDNNTQPCIPSSPSKEKENKTAVSRYETSVGDIRPKPVEMGIDNECTKWKLGSKDVNQRRRTLKSHSLSSSVNNSPHSDDNDSVCVSRSSSDSDNDVGSEKALNNDVFIEQEFTEDVTASDARDGKNLLDVGTSKLAETSGEKSELSDNTLKSRINCPSLLNTPEKQINTPNVKELSVSLLASPLIAFPAAGFSVVSPNKITSGQVASSLQKPIQSFIINNLKVHSGKEASSFDMNTNTNTIENEVTNTCTQNIVIHRTPLKNFNVLSGNNSSSNIANDTLVTSVYQSPILSSNIDGLSNMGMIINMSPQKPIAPLRKISPAKVLRSSLKTSPMKKVTPILRKYRHRKTIRCSSTKLSPILPKAIVTTPQKMRRTRSSAQRKLAPKTSKGNASVVASQASCITESNEKDHLIQMDEEPVLKSNASGQQNHSKEEGNRLEEEYEEDYLEEEEEEEEEEEDLEAAQQREEHLAALLKASSTIVGKRGDKISGGYMGHERRLNKQQRRLQARITALSIVQDSFDKDNCKFRQYQHVQYLSFSIKLIEIERILHNIPSVKLVN
ncbi:hypothetical protein SK128_025084 [Halocaridina rubra]|uniref:Uncharacterized protein n=1 Tax=Halocaridina rubra TaxID=373956 RepID=A0AAN8XP56_HALRR